MSFSLFATPPVFFISGFSATPAETLAVAVRPVTSLGHMKHKQKRVVKDNPQKSDPCSPSKPTSTIQEACPLRSGRALHDKVIQDDPCICRPLVHKVIQDDFAYALILHTVAILSQSQKVTPFALSQHTPLS